MALLWSVLAAAVAAAAPSGAAGQHAFKTWAAYCDNGARCSLFGFGAESAAAGGLELTREPGPSGATTVAMVGLGDDVGPQLTLSVEGGPKPQRFGPYRVKRGKEDEPRDADIPAADAGALVRALRDGARLIADAGGEKLSIPLAGAAAAMLWVDDRQGRVGTATAWMRPGPKPASAVPPAPALPLVRAAGSATAIREKPPAALLASHELEDCEAERVKDPERRQGFRLGPDLQLWLIGCEAGAYNQTYRVLLSDGQGRKVRLAPLQPLPGDTGPSSDVTDGGFEAKTMTLSSFAKGRGVGDCGDVREYAWDGRSFRLKSAQGIAQCQGVLPDDWPSLWRSR